MTLSKASSTEPKKGAFISGVRMPIERGVQIPEDISIFGFDCVEVCAMLNPPLPVVQQPEQRLGTLAADYLLERLEGSTQEPRQTRLACLLHENPRKG